MNIKQSINEKEAQLEVIRGYYNTIGFQKSITVEDIVQMLIKDREYLEGEIIVLKTEQIINKL